MIVCNGKTQAMEIEDTVFHRLQQVIYDQQQNKDTSNTLDFEMLQLLLLNVIDELQVKYLNLKEFKFDLNDTISPSPI